ncbi:endonuclease NucS [Aciditerrimonas ferrireducens]|uniref:endonuclease NucS n=1 Tax=Aciditerrimonas ferrireducens TaxID=667306 RepID=UPI002004909E|nr:endonuclease NucS [Aciditerrimonas ferrireducens]MCK4176962.1 endonuclease NucS [Aciditerrimonas ferrireducens]
MRLVIATCEVHYEGRLRADLPRGRRLLVLKADGSVAVHADDGAYKPLNWMVPPCTVTEEPGRWLVQGAKGERLEIRLYEVHLDVTHELGPEPGLAKDGVEVELQGHLAERPWVLEAGLELLAREYRTPLGPVDLLCRDASGGFVAVEVKRRGELASVEQLDRYLAALRTSDARLRPLRGLLAAERVAPNARRLCEARGMGWREVDLEALRRQPGRTPRLFDDLPEEATGGH